MAEAHPGQAIDSVYRHAARSPYELRQRRGILHLAGIFGTVISRFRVQGKRTLTCFKQTWLIGKSRARSKRLGARRGGGLPSDLVDGRGPFGTDLATAHETYLALQILICSYQQSQKMSNSPLFFRQCMIIELIDFFLPQLAAGRMHSVTQWRKCI